MLDKDRDGTTHEWLVRIRICRIWARSLWAPRRSRPLSFLAIRLRSESLWILRRTSFERLCSVCSDTREAPRFVYLRPAERRSGNSPPRETDVHRSSDQCHFHLLRFPRRSATTSDLHSASFLNAIRHAWWRNNAAMRPILKCQLQYVPFYNTKAVVRY